MRIATSVYESHDGVFGIDVAVIEVGPERAAVILGWLDAAAKAEEIDSQFLKTEYFSHDTTWYHVDPQKIVGEDQLDQFHDGRPVVVSDKVNLSVYEFEQDITQVAAVWRDGEVSWQAYVKHTDVSLETRLVSREMIEAAAKSKPDK